MSKARDPYFQDPNMGKPIYYMNRVLVNAKWWDEAACNGQSVYDFYPRPDEELKKFKERVRVYRGTLTCPPTCPVMRECAKDALLKGDWGVIRGGVYIATQASRGSRGARQKLMELAEPILTPTELSAIKRQWGTSSTPKKKKRESV